MYEMKWKETKVIVGYQRMPRKSTQHVIKIQFADTAEKWTIILENCLHTQHSIGLI
jgi:hypothetical protein